jgi:hypothetical protein
VTGHPFRFADVEGRIRRASALLTAPRVRAQAIVLLVSCWIPYVVLASTGSLSASGNRVAGDFIHFYVLGAEAVEERETALYDEDLQVHDVQRLAPGVGPVRYLTPYGPQVSLFFAPLALLSYPVATGAWLTISAVLYAICIRAVWSTCPHLVASGSTVALLAIGFPGFFFLIAFGQNSALALLCFTAGYFALRKRRRFLAGLAFGTLVFKPQLGLAVALIFLLTREWTIVGGAVIAAMAQLATAWLRYSSEVFSAYARALHHVADMAQEMEWQPYQMHSLRGFSLLLIPWPSIALIFTVCATVIAILLAVRVWRSDATLEVRYVVILLVTALTTPHFHGYDLVIVAPALLLAADWGLSNPAHRLTPFVRVLVYACCLLPLLWPVAKLTHVQLSTVALAGLTVVLYRCALTAPASTVSNARTSPHESSVQLLP